MIKLKSIGWCLCCALGLSAQGAEPMDQAVAPAAPSPAERIADLAGQVRRAQWLEAIQAGQALLAEPAELAERQRGEVHFATALAWAMHEAESAGSQVPALAPAPPAAGHAPAPGLLPAQAPSPKPPLGAGYLAASADFETSRALAGPGELRLSATYDLGTSALMRAELWRLEIPEIAQAAGQQAPAAPGAAGNPEEEAPDPLEEARSAYLQAKASLILRLRSDWRDADTRANLEWIQRRLRELKEIEEQRKKEEQEKEQDPDQQQDDQDGGDGQDGEPGDEGEDQNQDPKDPEDPKDPKDPGDEGDESPEDQEGGEDPESEQEPQDDGEPEQEGQEQRPDSEADGGEAQSSGQQPAERVMTREEVIRLLDKLADLEAEAQTLKDAQVKSQTVRVDRDW